MFHLLCSCWQFKDEDEAVKAAEAAKAAMKVEVTAQVSLHSISFFFELSI
jgi:hypothetical protein